MKRLLFCLAVVLLGAATLLMFHSQSTARAAKEKTRTAKENREKEHKLTINKVPPKVRAAIRKLAKRNEIKEIERVSKKCYEAEWRQGKNEVEVLVTADGKLVNKEVEKAGDDEDEDEAKEDEDEDEDEAEAEEDEDEDEDEAEEEEHEVEISLRKVPAKAKAAILKLAKKNKIQEVEEVRVTLYEAEWMQGKSEVEILLTGSGQVINKEVEREDEEKAEEDEDEDEDEAEEDEDEDEDEAEEDEDEDEDEAEEDEDEDEDEDEAEEDEDEDEDEAEEDEDEEEEEEEEEEHEHEREVKVSLDQVPAKVRATIKKAAGDNPLKELEQSTVKLFEAEWIRGNRVMEIVVTPNGKVLSREVEKAGEDEEKEAAKEKEEEGEEHEVATSLGKLPAKAKAAILKAAGDNKIKEVERVTVKVYEAEWKQGDRTVEIVVAFDGKVLKREVEKKNEEDEDEDEK